MKHPWVKYVKVCLNLMTALAVLLLVLFVLPRVLRFFMPFVVGWVIALVANPLVRFLDEKIRIRRKAGSAIVIVAAIALVIGAGYWAGSILVREAIGFVHELPRIWEALEEDVGNAGSLILSLGRYLPDNLEEQLANLMDSMTGFLSSIANELGTPTVSAVGNFARNIPSIFISVIMCLLSSYFFVAEREEVIHTLQKYVPAGFREKWTVMYSSMMSAVGGYFKAQFKIGIWMYFLLLIGLLILKVNYAAIIALGIAVLDFFPVFGTGTVLVPWAVIKILGADYKMALGLLIIWGVGQLARQLIQPKIVGDSIGVPAIPTLFLLFIGYRVGGVGGMILAVPLGIIVANMYQAGFFSTTIDSLKILIHGFNRFRRLTEEDKKEEP